jgi:lanosterol synthase
VEDKQTNYVNLAPVNKAINSICIWHSYGKDSEQFQKHYERWFDYLWVAEDGMKMGGYNGDQLWETAFTVRAMNESNIGKDFPKDMIKMYDFVDKMQIREENYKYKEFFRHEAKGGWAFSTIENAWLVSDCTAEGLGACLSMHHQKIGEQQVSDERLKEAVDVLLRMQNNDGGWATYENTRAAKWLEALNPSEVFADIMLDYSWVECSSAVVQGLLEFKEQFPKYKKAEIDEAVKIAIDFILSKQREDGSWYGGWGVCFTYGTMFGIEACSRVKSLGIYDDNVLETSMQKACAFLVKHQKNDGGWGESFESCSKKVYVEAYTSQVINTAWSLLALIAADYKDTTVIEKGIELLLQRQTEEGDWLQENISGVFNFNCMETYSNYRNIFPLWALNRWFGKFDFK